MARWHDCRLLREPPRQRLERLLELELEGSLPPFLFFWGDTATATHAGPWVLSQWWPASFEIDSVIYANTETYMMCEKARIFGDETTRSEILTAPHPAVAKDLGRRVLAFDESVWQTHRYDIVLRGNMAKFGQRDELRQYLLSTAPRVLVEASPATACGVSASPHVTYSRIGRANGEDPTCSASR